MALLADLTAYADHPYAAHDELARAWWPVNRWNVPGATVRDTLRVVVNAFGEELFDGEGAAGRRLGGAVQCVAWKPSDFARALTY